MRLLAVIALVTAACRGDVETAAVEPVRFWHSFSPAETDALNRFLATQAHRPVATTRLPFSRARTALVTAVTTSADCPDLARIDATWLPQLVAAGTLWAAPLHLIEARQWHPEALELASHDGQVYALPESLDGLALLGRAQRLPAGWPPANLDQIASSRTRAAAYAIGLRVDGYWFVPFLRDAGVSLPGTATTELAIAAPSGVRALERFAALFSDQLAPDLTGDRDQARELTRRFARGEIDVLVEGPWAVADLFELGAGDLAIAPLPRAATGRPTAPRGGHLLVVPTCARRSEEAWQLAAMLTDPELQASWAREHGSIPTTRTGLDQAGELSRAFYRALAAAEPLPRHPLSADLFDDLTPAIEAVVAGDASAEEALAGVDRAWRRLARQHNLELSAPGDAGVVP